MDLRVDEKWIGKSLNRTALFCIIASIFLMAGGGITADLINRMFEGTLRGQLVTETAQYNENIERKLEADIQILETLASFMEFSSTMDGDQFTRGLYESNNQNSFIRMGYFEKNGNGIRVTLNGDIEQDIEATQTDPAVYQVIEAAWKGEVAVSEVYNDGSEHKGYIAYAVPVWKDEAVIGALTASQSIQVFLDILDAQGRFCSQGSLHIVRADGSEIFSGETWQGLSEEEQTAFEAAAQREESIFLKLNRNGTVYQAYAEPMGLHDWYLLFIVPKQGINETVYRDMLITRVSFLLVVIIANFCIFRGYRMLRKSSMELVKYAYYDPVTGAFNMLRFSQLLEPVIHETRQFSVVALNIRKFKFINEIFGDEAANALLCEVKSVLEASVNEDEFFCRETADKFYILLRTADKEEVRQRLEKIAARISTLFLERHRHYRIMLYMGVAAGVDMQQGEIRREEVMTHVMFALNSAREGQQDNLWFYNTQLHASEELANYIESHMNRALQHGEFKMFLQPKIELKTGKMVGAEALVRWIKADGTMIFPNQFIPLFEQNGFSVELDMYMVEQVCRQIRFWMDSYGVSIPISVNQSKLLFYQDNYVEKLCELIERYQVPARMITLEILEGLALEDARGLNDRLLELKEKGFRISMDDFGSGYSSFNTLSSLDIDELKLDRGFLMEMHGSRRERQQLILEQIAQLAGKMNITTVAEGVETREDEEIILQAGCDYGQGYYYSRPIDAQVFTEIYF